MPAETHTHFASLDRQRILEIVQDRLGEILESEPSTILEEMSRVDDLHADSLAQYQLVEALVAAGRRREVPPLQTYVETRLDGGAGPAWLDSQDVEQASKSCEEARKGGNSVTEAMIYVPQGGRDNPQLAGQLMQGLNQLQPYFEQSVKSLCK